MDPLLKFMYLLHDSSGWLLSLTMLFYQETGWQCLLTLCLLKNTYWIFDFYLRNCYVLRLSIKMAA